LLDHDDLIFLLISSIALELSAVPFLDYCIDSISTYVNGCYFGTEDID